MEQSIIWLLPAVTEGKAEIVGARDDIGVAEKIDGDAVALPVVNLEREGVWVKGMVPVGVGKVGKGEPVSVGLEVAVAFSPVGRICPVHPTTKAKRRSERVIKREANDRGPFCAKPLKSPGNPVESRTVVCLYLTSSMAATPPNVVFQWLDRIGLGYAVPNFSAYSIDSPQKLMGIDVKTYSALGVLNQEDRKRLFELVQRVRDVSPFLSFHDTPLQPGVAVSA